MPFTRSLVVSICSALLVCPVAAASQLVTGNGFGFAVVSPQTGAVISFYAHPYSFVRPDSHNPLSEGVPTTNFIKALHWNDSTAPVTSTDYLEESQIVQVSNRTGEGTFFMPFGCPLPVLVIDWEPAPTTAPHGHWQVQWSHAVRSERHVRASGVEVQLVKFDDIPESLLLIPLAPAQTASVEPGQMLAASPAWALVSLEREVDLRNKVREFIRWRAGLPARALAKRESSEIERWRTRPTVEFPREEERRLWRQSEIMLRMAQSRESNRPGRYNNGLIVAALPDGLWVTPWVRDMAYATVALARMGHQSEARSALLAYFNARPTGKMRAQTREADYQVSVVRYFGDGSEEPFFTMEGSTNIEFDNWGLVLWALGEYLNRYDDPGLLKTATYRGRLYESARDYVLNPLLANLETYNQGLIVSRDTSIWEERQKDAKHFAFSTAAAIAGLREFAQAAARMGDERTRNRILERLALLEKGFHDAFVRDGKLRGTLEEGVKNDIDGALLAVINLGVITDPTIIRDVVERMDLLKVRSGGYRRVRSVLTDPAIFEYWYERQEFVFVDLSLAEVFERLGRETDAAALLKRIVDKAAADHNLIPEMYVAEPCTLFPGEIGAPTGAIPMVGYGAGAYILEALRQVPYPSH